MPHPRQTTQPNARELRAGALLVAALAKRGVRVVAGRASVPWRQARRPAGMLEIGVRDLARHAAAFAKHSMQLKMLFRIRNAVRTTGNPQLVMQACREYERTMGGRPGFTALRLYNAFYARQRALSRRRKR